MPNIVADTDVTNFDKRTEVVFTSLRATSRMIADAERTIEHCAVLQKYPAIKVALYAIIGTKIYFFGTFTSYFLTNAAIKYSIMNQITLYPSPMASCGRT